MADVKPATRINQIFVQMNGVNYEALMAEAREVAKGLAPDEPSAIEGVLMRYEAFKSTVEAGGTIPPPRRYGRPV